jgi:mRNA interferase RelE/StbE
MFEVRISRQAIKDIASLPQEYARLVSQYIDRLKEEPRPPGARKLRNFTAVYRLRVGVYRILYEIDDKAGIVTVYRVKHRREAYR